MANPHLVAIQAAIKSNRSLGTLFRSMVGSRANPRGDVVTAHRKARRLLKGSIGKPQEQAILSTYREEVIAAITVAAAEAAQIGLEQAQRNAEVLGISVGGADIAGLTASFVAQVTQTLDAQLAAIASGMLTEAQVIGGGNNLGMFTYAQVQREALSGLAVLAGTVFTRALLDGFALAQLATGASPFVKQAVAAIDAATTPCCLGVHGQVQELDQPFVTPDPPAFSSLQERVPFHFGCRTSQAMVLREMADDKYTGFMRDAAALERSLRGKPGYTVPKFVNAFTRIRK